MEPMDDAKLNKLLREWRVEDAPESLDERVLGAPRKWWRVLLTGSIRVPVPVGVALAAIVIAMAAALWRESRAPEPLAPATVNLAGFRPVSDMNVRVIHHDASN